MSENIVWANAPENIDKNWYIINKDGSITYIRNLRNESN